MGKRQRHSEFVGLTDEELLRLIHDDRHAYPQRMCGRYRTRTWFRGRVPWSLAERIPKGEDCGAHEWYRQRAELDASYHCRVTRPHETMSVSGELLADLERATRAGSGAAENALLERIRDGSAHVVPNDRPTR